MSALDTAAAGKKSKLEEVSGDILPWPSLRQSEVRAVIT